MYSSPVGGRSDNSGMVLEHTSRLRILAALAGEPRQEFVRLRQNTRMTDGNLCAHVRRLESAGCVAVEKQFRDRKPVTYLRLTDTGRAALEGHVRGLMSAVGLGGASRAPVVIVAPRAVEPDDWVD